jgi:hypothetical protein
VLPKRESAGRGGKNGKGRQSAPRAFGTNDHGAGMKAHENYKGGTRIDTGEGEGRHADDAHADEGGFSRSSLVSSFRSFLLLLLLLVVLLRYFPF